MLSFFIKNIRFSSTFNYFKDNKSIQNYNKEIKNKLLKNLKNNENYVKKFINKIDINNKFIKIEYSESHDVKPFIKKIK